MTPPRRDRTDEEEEHASLLGLGFAVERLRSEATLTRDSVAKRGGIPGSTVAEIEEGRKEEPRWATIRRLAKGLGVATVELVRLGVELAPGPGGERLRQKELNPHVSLAEGIETLRVADPSSYREGVESPGTDNDVGRDR